MSESNKKESTEKVLLEWSVPELNEYSAAMYTSGKINYSKSENTSVTKGGKSEVSGPS